MAPVMPAILLAAAALPSVDAFFRMSCPSRLVQERIDPIITPGAISGHVHHVAGGNGFGFSTSYEQQRASQCSSCQIKEDLSAYWTPKLYYHAPNGSFIGVPVTGDYMGATGGMTVYYLQRPGAKNDKLHAFPEGFRMISGDPFKRNGTTDFAGQAISFACINYDNPGPETGYLPLKDCPQGLRAQVFFPQCWDGVNLDSADHKSHMAFPETGAYNGGTCPSSHPVHMISLFYEVLYDTSSFRDLWTPDGVNQPFVFAQGDATGYGYHGDFVNGWDVDVLQTAVDTCTADSGSVSDCPAFSLFTSDQCQACKVPNVLSDNINGPMNKLPGCNPVTNGPNRAPVRSFTCGLSTVIPPTNGATDVTTSLGYKYLGCGSDNTSNRTFDDAIKYDNGMTVEMCVTYCKGKGLKWAGLEYATQCYCSATAPSAATAPQTGIAGNCNMACGGDSSEVCGGPNALSMYKACAGTKNCKNPTVTVVGGLPTGATASAKKAKAQAASGKVKRSDLFGRRHADADADEEEQEESEDSLEKRSLWSDILDYLAGKSSSTTTDTTTTVTDEVKAVWVGFDNKFHAADSAPFTLSKIGIKVKRWLGIEKRDDGVEKRSLWSDILDYLNGKSSSTTTTVTDTTTSVTDDTKPVWVGFDNHFDAEDAAPFTLSGIVKRWLGIDGLGEKVKKHHEEKRRVGVQP